METARSYLGVRWKHQGRSRGAIDCVGLIVAVGLEHNLIENFEDQSYTRSSTGMELLEPFKKYGVQVHLKGSFDELNDGDILILREQQYPQHVGIVGTKYGKKTLIHATVKRGKVVEEYLDENFAKTAITAFRYKALA